MDPGCVEAADNGPADQRTGYGEVAEAPLHVRFNAWIVRIQQRVGNAVKIEIGAQAAAGAAPIGAVDVNPLAAASSVRVSRGR